MADVQLMQARDASQQLFQILVIDAMARIHLDAQGMGQFRGAFETGQFLRALPAGMVGKTAWKMRILPIRSNGILVLPVRILE